MRRKWLSLASVSGAIALMGCLDIGGKLDTPIDGSGGGSLGGGGLSGGSLAPAGDGGGATGTFACDYRSLDSTCSNFAAGTTQTYAQASCSGTLLQTRCPTAMSVGTCTRFGEVERYYSTGATPFTAATARSTCAYFGGAFSN